MAIGYPLGMDLSSSVTVGVISGIDRALSSQSGALVNRFGQVIGINNRNIASTSMEGIGFSIPILLKIIENATTTK